MVFAALQVFLRDESKDIFIVDSFPVPAYQNHKSFLPEFCKWLLRAKIFNTKGYHGYTASKKQYFFGINVHVIIHVDGAPIEFLFAPGLTADISALSLFDLNMSAGSKLLGDRAYTSYSIEDMLLQLKEIHLIPKRKSRHKRQHSSEKNELIKKFRNQIETVFSSIVSRMPRQIKAQCERGFCLKVIFLILAYMFTLL